MGIWYLYIKGRCLAPAEHPLRRSREASRERERERRWKRRLWRRNRLWRWQRSAVPSARLPWTAASSAPASHPQPSSRCPLPCEAVSSDSLSLFFFLRSHSAMRRVHRGHDDRVRGHRAAPLRQHRPRGWWHVPRARGGLPADDPRSRRHPIGFARVQLLLHG